MTERHGGGDTRFARVNDAPVFRSESAQVEYVDFKSLETRNDIFGQIHQTKRFGHFTGTAPVCARRAVNQENP